MTRRPSTVPGDGFVHTLPDVDPTETQEWLDSLDSVVNHGGKGRARYLISALLERARELQVGLPATISSPYVNTIPPEQQAWRWGRFAPNENERGSR